MLQVYKNEAITRVTREQMEIREMELEWYTRNYDTMALQAALFAGFAHAQLTTSVPEGTNMYLEAVYACLNCLALGSELCVCLSCLCCCIFGKGLALRGPSGARSMHVAVDNLQREQRFIFTQFLTGTLGYLCSQIIKMWIYFRPRIAMTVSIPLVIFGLSVVSYVKYTVGALQVDDSTALTGRIAAWGPYEQMGDLDEASYEPMQAATERPSNGVFYSSSAFK
mmetsp:Transcript_114958/g.245475  ORF Transcript_114958/g.245475 Transcript_114958/m.245475 type:complete len:224 (-) Transcript_114958:145-816(-)